jgi:Protein of unknown function (DUF1302)
MRTWAGWLSLGLVLGAGSFAHAFFLDKGRNFDVRLRAYSQLTILAEDARETAACTIDDPTSSDPKDKIRLNACYQGKTGDLMSQRNFYNPEFDAKLTDYTRWMGEVPGLSFISPEDFKFRFAWWGFYDGIFDYMDDKWNRARQGGGYMTRLGRTVSTPLARQSVSNNILGESYAFNDENKNPRHIVASRNRINELYLDYTKGRFFTRIGRQAISWGESDTIALLDIQNPFDLTQGAPGFFMDVEEARIPLWTLRNTIKLVDNLGPVSSLFADMYMVPGPIDNTIPYSTPSFFGFPYSQPGGDPALGLSPFVQQTANGGLFTPAHVVIVEREPKHTWDETRWGVRLAGVLLRDYTVSGWFFRSYPEQPVPLLIGGEPTITRTDIARTLIDNRGFKVPVCLDANGAPVKQPGKGGSSFGQTPSGRPCGFAKPVVTALYRRLVSVAGLGATWFSQPLDGIIRTELEYFIDQDAFIPGENLDPQVQVPGGSKVQNHIAKADYLRWTIGYDRFFFFRPLNPSNSFVLVATHNGSWNTSSTFSHRDYRTALAKPGKSQATIPTGGSFTDVQAIPKTFEDENTVEHFFQFALQTDYMHGRLSPRAVVILDPSGIFGFSLSATYRLTDYLLLSSGLYAVEGSRRSGLATFRDRDQIQMRVTYQLN